MVRGDRGKTYFDHKVAVVADEVMELEGKPAGRRVLGVELVLDAEVPVGHLLVGNRLAGRIWHGRSRMRRWSGSGR